jgi:hypothetical protein
MQASSKKRKKNSIDIKNNINTKKNNGSDSKKGKSRAIKMKTSGTPECHLFKLSRDIFLHSIFPHLSPIELYQFEKTCIIARSYANERWDMLSLNMSDLHHDLKGKAVLISRHEHQCIGCGDKKPIKYEYRGMTTVYICFKCTYKEDGKFKMISATDAHKYYKISKSVLKNLYSYKFNYMNNPCSKFFLSDIKDNMVMSIEELEKKKQNDRKKAEKAKKTIEKRKAERRSTLETLLKQEGLSLREDSRICDDFITNKNPMMNEIEIVKIMKKMDILHKHNLAERWRYYLKNSISEYLPKDEYQIEYEDFKDLLYSAIQSGRVEDYPKY